jgi:hypothetical protein
VYRDKSANPKIIICPEQYKLTFAYHQNQNNFKDYKNLGSNFLKDKIYPINNLSEFASTLDSSDNFTFIDAHADFMYPQNGILQKLTSIYHLKNKTVFKDSTIIYEFQGSKLLLDSH